MAKGICIGLVTGALAVLPFIVRDIEKRLASIDRTLCITNGGSMESYGCRVEKR